MHHVWKIITESPSREYIGLGFLVIGFLAAQMFQQPICLLVGTIPGIIPTLMGAFQSLGRTKISIDVFNTFAVAISALTGVWYSTAFITLMLLFARWLEWRVGKHTTDAVADLLALRPKTVTVLRGKERVIIPASMLAKHDSVVLVTGDRVPCDGILKSGSVHLNESSVTGEPLPIKKDKGSSILSGTLVEDGYGIMEAKAVGKDSMVEKLAELMRHALKNKSKAERLADQFASIFLPLVIIVGFFVYLWTRNPLTVAALFLVVCADEMSVAIPLAMMATIGHAAKQGIVVKGGLFIDVFARTKAFVFDKTGTLTFGDLRVSQTHILPGITEKEVWTLVTATESASEHPVGRALYAYAKRRAIHVIEPTHVKILRGKGIKANVAGRTVMIGNDSTVPVDTQLHLKPLLTGERRVHLFIDDELVGFVLLKDKLRPEAEETIKGLRLQGIKHFALLSGDADETSQRTGSLLAFNEVHGNVLPDQKLAYVKSIKDTHGTLAMVGDGINDAPALALADVGIAMGRGSEVALEAADIVLLNDRIERLVTFKQLCVRARSVVRWNMGLWFVLNSTGFVLVILGYLDPAQAAAYNFFTDFLPLTNSARLFRMIKKTK